MQDNARPASVPTDNTVRLHRQSKGRGGKPVTLIKGLGLNRLELKALCKQLKSRFGVGGSCVDEDILIQGDMRERLAEELVSRGFTVKISGG
jgi:translation initiation factor 1